MSTVRWLLVAIAIMMVAQQEKEGGWMDRPNLFKQTMLFLLRVEANNQMHSLWSFRLEDLLILSYKIQL